jgi:hypothetical protein
MVFSSSLSTAGVLKLWFVNCNCPAIEVRLHRCLIIINNCLLIPIFLIRIVLTYYNSNKEGHGEIGENVNFGYTRLLLAFS